MILTDDLGMQRVAVKFVLKLLLCEQIVLCLDVMQDMLVVKDDPDFLKTVMNI